MIRVKLLHYLKDEILKGYLEKISSDCNISEIDLPSVPVDGDLPAPWWDDDADKSLLVGIFKHGHDKFNLMRQDPNLCFLSKCGPPDKDELLAEMNCVDRGVDDLDDENRETKNCLPELAKSTINNGRNSTIVKDVEAGEVLDNLVNNVVEDLLHTDDFDKDSDATVDENKNSIHQCHDHLENADEEFGNSAVETEREAKMDVTDDESLTNETTQEEIVQELTESGQEPQSDQFLPFPTANDLNQRFRRLITAYQRNSKKLEIKLAQKARDELKKERTSKFEAAKNEREERKRFLAQKWSRREEADFFRAISSFGVEYDPHEKRHDWNRFRSIGKLDKKLDETLEEYYKAFIIMCKRVTSRPLTSDEEKCPINVDTITEERASRCLARIEFLNKIREQIITHPELDERLKLSHPQSDLPDWWENGIHDKELLFAAAKHGLTRLDYNLAHDTTLSFDTLIRQRSEQLFTQTPAPVLIPIEQIQELLEKNGIEYKKDLELQTESDDVRVVIDSLLDAIESDYVPAENEYKSFVELVDGPHSRLGEDSSDKSLLAGSLQSLRSPLKATRSSTNLNLITRSLPTIIARRTANTVAKSAEPANSNSHCIQLTSIDDYIKTDEQRLVEITPILPEKIPGDITKTFEAGEISMTVQSDSALLKLDDKEPLILSGSSNPITVKIRWPKDKAIQTRLENLVYLVEKNEWPCPTRPTVPTITLPNHLAASSSQSTPLTVTTTSSPTKNDKSDLSLGSPKSDISNISSRTSKQDTKERSNDFSTSRGRRGRGRKLRHPESDHSTQDIDSPGEDRQAAAKLRNLLSQGSNSNKNVNLLGGDKLTAKFGGNKQGAGLSSLLASFKQKRAESSSSSRSRDDKDPLDLNAPGTANLLPQILANMKPEFRDLLANQDAATMLLNSLTSMTGSSNIGSNLRSSNTASNQVSLENIVDLPRSSKGPPPAHQRSDNPPSAHGNSSTRELRRSSQSAHREISPSSINLRSSRGKSSLTRDLDNINHQKSSDVAHGKLTSKKRGRPSSSASESPPGPTGADVLDLSSLPLLAKGGSASRSESRSRRHRDLNFESSAGTSTRSSSSVPTKANLKAGTKQNQPPQELDQSEKGARTTRASKRIGSRIDALALNLQAKRLNRGDSPSADVSPSLPRDKAQDSPMAAHGSAKPSNDHNKSQNSKAPPPAAHSGHKPTSSSTSSNQSRDKPSQIPPTSLTSQSATPSASRQDPLAQFMTSQAPLLSGLSPGALGGAGDLMNQLLRKAGTNDIVKNLLNEFMKNPSLALDPNILATLSASLPLGGQGLPGFTMPPQTPTSLPSGSSKSIPNSLLNDFKSPTGNRMMKRSRQESTSNSSRQTSSNNPTLSSDSRRSSSSTPDRHERKSTSTDRRSSSYQDRPDKHGKHEKRSGGVVQQESVGDTSSSRRSSSSLLAQQVTTSQQTSQVQTSSATTSSQSGLPNAATLNLANQFGGLNSLGGLLSFPGMNELMKQMSNFPGLGASLPRVTGAPVVSNSAPTSNASIQSNSDRGSRRSRQSAGVATTQTSSVSNQQAANAALANSIMNLASQPGAAQNPYSNYANPLANPFLPFGLANLGMNNPLGMGLFSNLPNLYMPSGFPTPEQQQQQPPQSSTQTSSSTESTSKDKKMRYSRK